ncbi:hypothetical protein CYMTET_22078 [Cymbomonas tetramitiformis]|uniref:Cytochrome b561 domain-containing protein n=1 Tax=Cymbomonas tetramitiformis TaxID=36881 RepID=A0AAE0G138_9CHLO|nr:hypothetical protein CYMTET_22078 [Cymbomonas tetramitiformis]
MDSSLPSWMVHSCIGVAALTIPMVYFDGQLFGYHTTLMSAGYILCMGEGVLLASKAVVLPAGEDRLRLLKKHMYLQVAAWAAIVGGFYAIYHNKDIHGKPHFTSYHSWLGVLTLITTFLTPVTGALGFKYLGLMNYLPPGSGDVVKAIHRKQGSVVYFGSLFVILLGLYTPGINKGMLTYFMMASATAATCMILHNYINKYDKQSLPGGP